MARVSAVDRRQGRAAMGKAGKELETGQGNDRDGNRRMAQDRCRGRVEKGKAEQEPRTEYARDAGIGAETEQGGKGMRRLYREACLGND